MIMQSFGKILSLINTSTNTTIAPTNNDDDIIHLVNQHPPHIIKLKSAGQTTLSTPSDLSKKKIQDIHNSIKRMDDNCYPIATLQFTIHLIQKTLPILDQITTTPEDQIAYNNIKQALSTSCHLSETIAKIPQPDKAEDYLPYLQNIMLHLKAIKYPLKKTFLPKYPHIFFQKPSPSVQGKKSLLLAKFSIEYLKILQDAYLYNADQKNIENNLPEKMVKKLHLQRKTFAKIQHYLKKSIETHPSCSHIELNNMIDLLKIREERMQKKSIEKNQNNQQNDAAHSIALETLKELKESSISALLLMVNFPADYPLFSGQEQINAEKNERLHDLLFSANPEKYLMVHYFPELQKELDDSFAFNHPAISDYFSQHYHNENIEEKNKLIDIIEHKIQAEYTLMGGASLFSHKENIKDDISVYSDFTEESYSND